jgi:hypothetical protein
MAPDTSPEYDRRKIRIGLAMVSVVVVAAIVLMLVVDSALGRAIMFAVAVTALVRAFLLSRALRRGR